jgi:bacteriorhodopsin
MQICRKTSNRAGLFVWLPGFQMIPLLRAAGMSPWLFLLLCVPGINAIITIIWSFRICRVRQKSAFLGVLLLLPVTNVLAFVYLALSGYGPGDEEQQRDNGKIKLAFQSSS